MIHHLKLGLLVAGLLSISVVASGQNRIAAARPAWHPTQVASSNAFARGSTPLRPIIVRLPAPPVVHRVAASDSQTVSASDGSIVPNAANSFIFPGATSFDLGQLLNNVPGFGFNYTTLAALNQNFAEQAFINPVTQQEIALSERLQNTRGFGGAFIPFFGGYSEPVLEQQQQPPVILLQQPAAAAEEPAGESAAAAPAEEQPPLPDVGEFVLVLHNGNQIKAVAFTRQNDQIIYITKDGVRASFPAADLDATATQQLNQQHGTPLQLSL
ncbi:MAG: hypothetical protein WBD87_03920 [Candidatus Acidiferrales bacterium]